MTRGLMNLGNTCYLNSALQILAHVPDLTNHLFRNPYEGECELTREYSKLVRELWKKDQEAFSPRDFHRVFMQKYPQFVQFHPHDVQEVILCIIDTLEKSLGVGFIQNIFNGTETQEIVYPNGTSRKEHDVTTIVLTPSESGQSLADLMKKRERFEAFSGYIDDAGKEYHAAVSKTSITKYPETLLFSFNQYQKKNAVLVPQRFENYALAGLVVHYGTSYGGHYAVFVKHKGTWRYIDDDTVVEKQPPEAGDYYIAWYKKRFTAG